MAQRRAAPMAERRVSRWYFGGLASCGAACCTHPLDLLKVRGGKRREWGWRAEKGYEEGEAEGWR